MTGISGNRPLRRCKAFLACRARLDVAVSLLFLFGCNSVPPDDVGDEWSGPTGTFHEVFRDDFNGPSGSAPDPAKWNVAVRERGLNQELDFNTSDRKNSFLDGQGQLVIQALKEQYTTSTGRISTQPYTSARLTTEGLLEQRYGRFQARIKLPKGKGLWPAFWMLGTRIDSVGWPECGEIDVLELAGSRPDTIKGSLHGPGYAGTASLTKPYQLDAGTFADGFHVFTLEWSPEGIRWLVDGDVYHSRTLHGLQQQGYRWVFDDPVYVILNLAVGGLYDGPPDASTVFPSQMVVDYVSVSVLAP
jgi:beta-glucanase (GH16 family)